MATAKRSRVARKPTAGDGTARGGDACPQAERFERAAMEGMALGEARLLGAGEWSDIRQTARHTLVRTNDVARRRLN